MKEKENKTKELLDIRSDPVFKAVFTKDSPESIGALRNLVSAVIGMEITITKIVANEPPIENLRDRQVRFDINCRGNDGQLINVEMCFHAYDYEPVRLEFHAAKLFIGQDIKGINKEYDDLKQTYQIGILAKKRFFTDNHYYHSFEYFDPVNQVSLNGRTRIITLELIKADEIAEKQVEEMSISERWIYFFEYLTDKDKRDKINEILKKEGGIAMANQVLMSISQDEEERARLMRDEKILLDYYSGINYMKRKGLKEGLEEGRKEGLKEGHKEGLKEGHKEGLKEGRQEIIDLWKSGIPAEEILRNLETNMT